MDVAVVAAIVGIVGGVWMIVFGPTTLVERGRATYAGLKRWWASPDSALVEEYLRCLRPVLDSIDYRGLGPHYRHRLQVSLGSVYVPLTSAISNDPHLMPSPYTGLYERNDESRVPLTEVLHRSKRAIVLGRAGSGKTTLLRYFALTLANAIRENEQAVAARALNLDPARLPMPIYMPLADFGLQVAHAVEAGHDQLAQLPDFGEAMALHLGTLSADIDGPRLLEILRRDWGSCLILLDGLDEAGDIATRALVGELIEQWIADNQQHTYVVTARPQSYSGPTTLQASFDVWEIADFSYEDINAFVHAWHQEVLDGSATKPEEIAAAATELIQTIDGMPDVRDLAKTPLLLTAIVLIHHTADVLPGRRADLFECCTRALLGQWDMSKGGTRAKVAEWFPGEEDQSPSSRRTHLEYVAYHLVMNDVVSASGEELADVLARDAPHFRSQGTPALNRKRALAFLAGLAARGGVIEEVSDGQFGFTHPAFKDYLAARRLARLGACVEIVRHKAGIEHWQTVIRLACGHLSQHDPERATEMVDGLVDPGSGASSDRTTGLALALGCLLDADRPGLGIDTMEFVIESALGAMTDASNPIERRVELGSAVGWLGDPRSLDATVAVPPGPFVMGADGAAHEEPAHRAFTERFEIRIHPVTNAEFERFIKDHGYQNADWWTEAGWRWRRQLDIDRPFYWNHPKFRVPNHPVVGVSWFEAAAFSEWAGGRLPGEAEWEKAARGDDGRAWPWGSHFEAPCCNTGRVVDGPSPVGMFASCTSPYGTLDMAGNVWEWTCTIYTPYPYEPDDRESLQADGARVMRGGSWYGTAGEARCASRRWLHPGTRRFNFGLRLALDPTEGERGG